MRGHPLVPLPSLELKNLGIYDATVHAFAAALQVVVAVILGADLPASFPASPSGKFATLLLPRLRFTCGVAGDGDLPPIWEEVARVKGPTEGLSTLN